eukprot:747259-Hanusia_phi.AAC.1
MQNRSTPCFRREERTQGNRVGYRCCSSIAREAEEQLGMAAIRAGHEKEQLDNSENAIEDWTGRRRSEEISGRIRGKENKRRGKRE